MRLRCNSIRRIKNVLSGQLEDRISELHSRRDDQVTELHSHLDQRCSELHSHLDQRTSELHSHLDQRTSELHSHLDQRTSELQSRLEQQISELRSLLELREAEINRQAAESAALRGEIKRLCEMAADSTRRLDLVQWQARLALDVHATPLITATLSPHDHPLITVITPTRNRCALLMQTVQKMRGYEYDNWEMIICLDRCSDDTLVRVQQIGELDPRIRSVMSTQPGLGAARNCGLAAARGSIIVYLDDDNEFAPGWLKAVAWAFHTFPCVELLYGCMVLDNPARVDPQCREADRLPEIVMHPFSRDHLRQDNLSDIGAVAHRSGLPDAYFDEELTTMQDWEFLGRLVAERDPLLLPVPSILYRTGAPDRLSQLHHVLPDGEVIRERLNKLYNKSKGA